MATQYRNDFFALNQWEYFEFLTKQDSEEKKQIEELYRIMEDRVNIEEQYLKGLERVVNNLAQITLKGSLVEFVNNLVNAEREKLSVSRSYLFLVKKDSLEVIKELMKKQSIEIKYFITEQKKTEKEYRSSLEKSEKLKYAYVSQAKECDLIGLEVQTMNVNREITSEKRIKAAQKHIEYIKQKVENEEAYQAKVLEYNNLVERFRIQLEGFNRNLLEFKFSANEAVKQALGRVLDFEKTQALIYSNTIEQLYSKLEAVDTKQITRESAGAFSHIKAFPTKMTPVTYHSFFQQAWNELQNQNNPNDAKNKEIITAFRSYHENIIKSEFALPSSDFECEGLEQEERNNIGIVSYVIDSSWRGEETKPESMQKVFYYFATIYLPLSKLQQLLRDKFIRNVFVAGLQQFRLAGKFCVTPIGFKSMKTVLYYFLDECLNARDVINTTKIMILSLTFWKVINTQSKQEEKKYLQASIKWHPLWKDLDFWTAAMILSIHEEVVNKRSYKLEEQESEKETRERQKAIVCGQLLSYVHNMASFDVEKGDIKRIIKLFCQYYSLEDSDAKEIMATCEEISAKRDNAEGNDIFSKKESMAPKKKGLDSIKDFFLTKKTSNEANSDIKVSKNVQEVSEEKIEKKTSEVLKTPLEINSEMNTLASAEDT